MKKELLLLSAIIVLGCLDWLTTVTGVVYFGATEVNPLLSGLTTSSMVLFSAVKLSTVAIVGLAFYKATAINKSEASNWQFGTKFLTGGYSLTFLVLTIVVVNNIATVFRL